MFKPKVSAQEKADKAQRLSILGMTIAEKRDEAISARATSGIEETWSQCEDAYLGVDDLNRAEYTNAKWMKPVSINGPVTTSRQADNGNQSTAFVRLTSRYVDAGASKASEILLPIDDKPFALSPTPVPELVKQKDDITAMLHPNGQPMMRDAQPGEGAPSAPSAIPGQAPVAAAPGATPIAPQPMTKSDWAKQQLEKAEDAADAAETRIADWLVECNYPAEVRKVVFDAGRIGVGVIKGPVPDVRKSQALIKNGNDIALEIVKKTVPVLKWVDPWNVFPDPACGEDIHNGDYILERDYMAKRQLVGLKGRKGYLSAQIDKVLEEGPGKCFTENTNPAEEKNKKRYEVWYYYGTLTHEEMTAADAIGMKDVPDTQDDVYAMVMLVNDSIIKVVVNPLDSGTLPYHAFSWQRRNGHWAGCGVAEQISMPQRLVNASTRAMINNAGASAGPQIVVSRGVIEPANGDWSLTANKIWYKDPDAGGEDVASAFAFYDVPNTGDQLMKIVDYAFKLAEELANIPLMSQGHDGPNNPETFGGMELLNSNAQTLLRGIANTFDDCVTDPIIRMMYEWLLLDPSVPNEEKGDFNINAHGSIAMVERAIQEQLLAQVVQMSVQPAYKVDPSKAICEYLKAKRMDPRRVQYTVEEQEKMEQQPAQPPIQLAVAQLKAQSDQQIASGKIQSAQQLAQLDAQNNLQVEQARSQAALAMEQQDMAREQSNLANGQATPHMAAASARIEEARIRASSLAQVEASRAQSELAYAQTEADMARQNGQERLQEMQLKKELAILDYASKHNLTLIQVKAELAKTSMQEETKRQLASATMQLNADEGQHTRTHDLVKHVSNLNHEANQSANDRRSTAVQNSQDRQAEAEQNAQDRQAAAVSPINEATE